MRSKLAVWAAAAGMLVAVHAAHLHGRLAAVERREAETLARAERALKVQEDLLLMCQHRIGELEPANGPATTAAGLAPRLVRQ